MPGFLTSPSTVTHVHLRITQIFGAERLGQILLDLARRSSDRWQLADQRQINRTGLVDLDRLGKLRNLEDCDIDDVLGSDLVGGRFRIGDGRRLFSFLAGSGVGDGAGRCRLLGREPRHHLVFS